MDISDVLDELDDHGFSDTAQERKLSVVNDTIQDICAREPWPFLEASAAITLSAGDEAPTLPARFRAAIGLIIPSQGVVMTPERLDTIAKTYPNSLASTGLPYFYYFVGSELRVLPVPGTDYAAMLFYLQDHPEVDENTLGTELLIPSRHHRAIVLGSVTKLYAMEDDPELSALFNQQYEERLARMESDSWKRQYDRPDRVVDIWDGGDDY